MNQDTEKTKVIFKKYPNGDHEVIALFPELPGDMNPETCLSYECIGQHGAASTTWAGYILQPATPAEYALIKNDLENIGYNLRIARRFTRQDYESRMKKIAS